MAAALFHHAPEIRMASDEAAFDRGSIRTRASMARMQLLPLATAALWILLTDTVHAGRHGHHFGRHGHHVGGVSFEICYENVEVAEKMCFPGTLEKIDECSGVCNYARGIVRMDVSFCGNCGTEPEAEWWGKQDGLDLDEVERVLVHEGHEHDWFYESPAPAPMPAPEYEDDWGDDDDDAVAGDDDDAVGDDDDSIGDDDDSVGDDDDSVGDDDDSVGDDDDSTGDDDDSTGDDDDSIGDDDDSTGDDDDSIGDDDDGILGNDGDDEGDDGFGGN